jgi:membrane-associated phospholipid phosphatase
LPVDLAIISALLVACGIMLALEARGLNTTLELTFRGDVKRETAFLAQWGQSVATPLAGLLIWQLDPHRRVLGVALIATVCVTSLSCAILKRLLGRVRPRRPKAGQWLGPSWRHESGRESFPSSHSACAMTLSVYLAALYPAATTTFIGLAIVCAILRYVLDAHWPSDVLFGVALGWIVALVSLRVVPPASLVHG